ncbi:hypothetical protein Nepgr_023798 [Nepenthes gracilis]|uniref:Uncharacterized protein n=1 Tax=Nepenthes gracilis TaxID=150966 RepID=A0AAD3T349_NEPGR|nr:hypothetical protein Nepgr_023798 [Nepenthes gracilis]
MGGGDSLGNAANTTEEAPAAEAETEDSSGGEFEESPILLLVLLHKAIRAEISELRRLVVAAEENGACYLEVDIRRRFDFLKSVYKYHCAAEDEVIFLALDGRVKNISHTYSLEHKSIDDLFESIFCSLNGPLEDSGNKCEEFQELIFCVGTLQDTIYQHLLKEEKQVFPLLIKQFSDDEQASLVWRFLCSVPIMLLEDLFPWLTYFLSIDEQVGLKHCIRKVVPKDELLQKVVISWLDNKTRKSLGSCVQNGKLAQCPDEPTTSQDISKVNLSKIFFDRTLQWKKENCLLTNEEDNPVHGLRIWHSAIMSDFQKILEDLYEVRRSNKYSNLASVIVRIKFIVDVLIFYSNALSALFYPVLEDLAVVQPSFSYQPFPDRNEVKCLQRMLCYDNQISMPLSTFVEALCSKLESLVINVSEHFHLQETEVFPLISKNCNQETQQKLLFKSLHMMPLGLLKCAITWFSSHLPKDKFKPVLRGIEQSGFLENSFASLLHEWVRIGYSGKTSVEDLQDMFESRASYICEQIEDAETCRKVNLEMVKPFSVDMANNFSFSSSTGDFHVMKKHGTVYSSGINLHIFFPQTSSMRRPFPKFPANTVSVNSLEPSPMDHIYYFHKALRKDIEYLVLDSAELSENLGLLKDFHQHFHLLRSLYLLHSDAEDEVAFPALEAKQKVQNISHSYCIDHKLEVEYFDRISCILNELSELNLRVSITAGNSPDHNLMKYHELCFKLQDSCKSLQKILADHVHREEIELWPLFRECLSIEEQENITGHMLGRTGAEILQEMILWVMEFLTPEEQHAIMSLWRKAAKNTMFDEWLGEWWEGMNRYNTAKVADESNICCSQTENPLEIVSKYLCSEDSCDGGERFGYSCPVFSYGTKTDDKTDGHDEGQQNYDCCENTNLSCEKEEKVDVTDRVNKPPQFSLVTLKDGHRKNLLTMSQGELEAVIRRVSRDSSLDPQKKSYVIQNVLMSRWIVTQQLSNSENPISSYSGKLPGHCPSYRDTDKSIFGCKHYKKNCKLLAACCNQLFTCRRCHDDVSDHLMDRKSTTEMMCMQCLAIQPIHALCSTVSCNNFSMARYYCRICKLFDDEREIYHCPYCNLCRVGKGLGIDYFHCMKCNACMSRSLFMHVCREKCLEDRCPICHEDLFTSSIPVKALPCGHLMHSTCFQDYTCVQYTCPICSKSLGDMQVYFGMLDSLLAEEKIPDEYTGKTQPILCNDCEKKGSAAFHWLYHKCSFCGSYNTRLL